MSYVLSFMLSVDTFLVGGRGRGGGGGGGGGALTN